MRRSLIQALLLVFALAAAGCDEPPQPGATAQFRVALLTPGSIRDAGWNQSAYEGLERIRDELGAEIAHQQTATPQDFETGFRDFAAHGYDLVFGHGFEFQDAAAKVAAEFPDTIFITTSGSTIRANLAPIVFEMEQATYVLGFVGALVSRQGRVGAIGGIELPSVKSTFLAYEAGARAARGDVRAATSYLGSWTDVSAAREATLAQISDGVDVLIHNANEAAAGFFQAVRDSDGVIAFGTNKDQNHLAPERVLASATLNVPEALLQVAREIHEDRFQARSMRFGLAQGVVGIVWNDALLAGLPAGVKVRADQLVAEIESGALEVPRLDF